MSPVTRRRVEKRTAELNRLRLTQENLLREAIRAEIRAYNHTNPLAGELVLYEGLWDSIKSAASKAAEFGRRSHRTSRRDGNASQRLCPKPCQP